MAGKARPSQRPFKHRFSDLSSVNAYRGAAIRQSTFNFPKPSLAGVSDSAAELNTTEISTSNKAAANRSIDFSRRSSPETFANTTVCMFRSGVACSVWKQRRGHASSGTASQKYFFCALPKSILSNRPLRATRKTPLNGWLIDGVDWD